jgi:ABC-type lipoprotein export system ATPase subunit
LLLRAIADLDPNHGEVRLGDTVRSAVPGHQWRRLAGLLLAESHWWGDTVGEHHRHWSTEVLQALGFEEDVLHWRVRRLSTGERQRLALARLLANRPLALLLDEPVANLDSGNAQRVVQVIRHYQAQTQAPIFWVSHGDEGGSLPCRGRLNIDAGRAESLELPWN